MSTKEINWAKRLKEPTINYLKSLHVEEYKFLPAKDGLTEYGKNLNLGFSCFSLKINYILDQTEGLDNSYIKGWGNFINY